MRKAVLDASALLRFVDNEAGAERVEEYLEQARTGRLTISMSAVNWGEVTYAVMRGHGKQEARTLLPKLKSLPLNISPIDAEIAERAGEFKNDHKIPYADAFAGTLALAETAVLITADQDFRLVPASVIKIEFLPNKSTS